MSTWSTLFTGAPQRPVNEAALRMRTDLQESKLFFFLFSLETNAFALWHNHAREWINNTSTRDWEVEEEKKWTKVGETVKEGWWKRRERVKREKDLSHFLSDLPFTVQLSLEDLRPVLRLVGLLLQTLDLPLHRIQRGHTCHSSSLYALNLRLHVEK